MQTLDKTSVTSNYPKALIKPSTIAKTFSIEPIYEQNFEQLPSNEVLQDQNKAKNIDFENKRKSTPASHTLIGLTERSSTKHRYTDSQLIKNTLKPSILKNDQSDFETIQSSSLNNSRLSLSKELENSFNVMSAIDEMDSMASSATNYSNKIGGISVTKSRSFIIKAVVSVLIAIFFYVMMSAFGKGFWTFNPSANHNQTDISSQKLAYADLSREQMIQNSYSEAGRIVSIIDIKMLLILGGI